ncbi:MAG TPA: hypothetical protein VH500_22245 [Nitrososphaeraceae archaeon]|jgi:hypothetical protein
MLYLKLNLTVNLGDGYISGSAYFGQKSFKINIQESYHSIGKLVIPDDLQIDEGPGYVLFETEKNEEIRVECKILDEPTDMILFYIDIQTLMKLTKDLPTTMSISNE